MEETREEILANFQGITAIDDFATAFYYLEEANWDLITAINNRMPQQDSNMEGEDGIEIIDDNISVITPANTRPPDLEDCHAASTSTITNNTNNFITLQVNYNNKIYDISLPATATVMDLKKRLETLCAVPYCRQHISGLGGSKAIASATISSLNLARNAPIHLKSADDATMGDDEVAERLTQTYSLRVKHDNREFLLQFPGTKTVQEVKNDIYSFTDIPVRHQEWSGWPNIVGLDDTVLAMVGLDTPHHDLTVKKCQQKPHKEYKRIIVESSDSDNSSVEEIEDTAGFGGEEDMFVDLRRPARLQPLLSDRIDDEATGCIMFAQRFRERYGPNIPSFFEGNLQDAIKEACTKPANERKLFGLYLHHEKSVLSNVFCAQLLGCETVLQTLAANFIVYGWDLTHTSNCNMLLASISNVLGPVASMTVGSIPVERLPAIIIIMKVRSNTEIYSVINGNVGVSELVGMLVEAVERFGQQRGQDAKAEQEREARQKVKLEQDEAYQMSLEADRAKEEFKKQQKLEETQEFERAENARVIEETKKEELRNKAAARVPPSPAEGATNVSRIRVRLPPPHDMALERRFYEHDTLQALMDYLASEGYPQETYKVIASWPRRDLTMESQSSTLKDLKLYPQETVMLEER